MRFDIIDDDVHRFVPQSFVMEASPQKRQNKGLKLSMHSVFSLTFDKILSFLNVQESIILGRVNTLSRNPDLR